jgi:uncharacterized phage-associated protein
MAPPRAFLRRLAASTAVICDQLGGKVSRFELMKILYLSDRESLAETSRTITGDTYYSMENGPVLSLALNLAKGDARSDIQEIWDTAFDRQSINVRPKKGVKIDTSAISEFAEETLRRNADKISAMVKQHGMKGTADILHREWLEWKDPGTSRIHLSLREILSEGLEVPESDAAHVAQEDSYAKAAAEQSAFATKPLIVSE